MKCSILASHAKLELQLVSDSFFTLGRVLVCHLRGAVDGLVRFVDLHLSGRSKRSTVPFAKCLRFYEGTVCRRRWWHGSVGTTG
jgi:hypothetical protein